MALGLNGEGLPPASKANSMDVKRGSMDSGYHSMIGKPKYASQGNFSQATTLVRSVTESSPERSPRKLHKAISTTFSGAIQAFSNSVRSTTSYIYPTAGGPELPSSEWAECETPKMERRRNSMMSSIGSRKHRFAARAPIAGFESPKLPQSPVPVTQEKAPALDVEIPNPALDYESLRSTSVSRGLQLLAGVQLPTGNKTLWPGPTRLTADQASGNDRSKILHPFSSEIDDPYVGREDEPQQGSSLITSASDFPSQSLSPETHGRYPSDDKGYFSEVESNADASESGGLAPACRAPDVRTSSVCQVRTPPVSHVPITSSASPYRRTIPSRMSSSVPSRSKFPEPERAKQRSSLHPPCQRSSHQCANLEDGLDALLPAYEDTVYEADAESLKSSMGSRAAWERHRADRERRYMKIVDMAGDTESDEEIGPELGLQRSPSRKRVHYTGVLGLARVLMGESEPTSTPPAGTLRYAVEAIERSAFPVGDLRYAVEAIERPSITTFDPLETVFQQRPILSLSDAIDKHKTLQASDSQDSSPPRMEVPSSEPADLSPSRVALPSSPVSTPVDIPGVHDRTMMTMNLTASSPVSTPVDIPGVHDRTMMTMNLTDEGSLTLGAGNVDAQSICQSSFESTGLPAHSSPEQQPDTKPEGGFAAGLRAAGFSTPVDTSDKSYGGDLKTTSNFTPMSKKTSDRACREQSEVGYALPKPRPRNGAPFEHSSTVSAFSDDTDDSCAITTHSPSCNFPLLFPSLHVRSEPERHIRNAMDALTKDGSRRIRIAGPADTGINPSLPSPFDGPGDQDDKVGSKLYSSKTLEGTCSPRSLEQHDLQSPSPGITCRSQPSSNSSTSHEKFYQEPRQKIVSPTLIASRKTLRKQKKRSSGMGTVPLADVTMNPKIIFSKPESTPPKRLLDENRVLGETQTSLGGSARVAVGSVHIPSRSRRLCRKNRHEMYGGVLDAISRFEKSELSPGSESAKDA